MNKLEKSKKRELRSMFRTLGESDLLWIADNSLFEYDKKYLVKPKDEEYNETTK